MTKLVEKCINMGGGIFLHFASVLSFHDNVVTRKEYPVKEGGQKWYEREMRIGWESCIDRDDCSSG
jgi:hypothetical protein